eukprot:m.135381 g.135381  ORF g.135381 m.135381 type:complete len:148 (-) comp13903_c0_seq2:236-679(-)
MLAEDGHVPTWRNGAVDGEGAAVPPPAVQHSCQNVSKDVVDRSRPEPKYKAKARVAPLLINSPQEPTDSDSSSSVSPPVAVRRKRRAMMAAKLDSQALLSPVAPAMEPAFDKLVTEAAVRIRLRFNGTQRDARRGTALRGHRVSAAF